MTTLYKVKRKNGIEGPFTETQLRGMWTNGTLTADALYAPQGSEEWCPLTELCEIPERLTSLPPVAVEVEDSYSPATPQKPKENPVWKRTGIAVIVIACGCLLYVTDGFEHYPERPNITLSKGEPGKPVSLHPDELRKITGTSGFSEPFFMASLYNGTEWTVESVDVIISRSKPKSDSRRFRLLPVDTTTDINPATSSLFQKKIAPRLV